MAFAVKTAVLVHGYHLEAPNWGEVVWGGGAGRIAHGARVAEAFGADLLMVGSGASTHGDTGETEGAYTLRWLRERRGAVSGAPTLVESATASLRAALGLDPAIAIACSSNESIRHCARHLSPLVVATRCREVRRPRPRIPVVPHLCARRRRRRCCARAAAAAGEVGRRC